MFAIYVRIASCDDMPHVDRLHAEVYHDEGYLPCAEPPAMTRVSPYADMRYTRVFLACVREFGAEERVVGTLSVTKQGALGFPFFMEEFSELPPLLREDGACIALLWRFAVAHKFRSHGLPLQLFRAAYEYGVESGISRAVCIVHPDKHEHFYRDKLGFARIGTPKYSPDVADARVTATGLINAPAVLLSACIQDVGVRLDELNAGIVRINRK